MTPVQPKRVMIVGPPRFWRTAFGEVRRRGDRVVRLALPSASTSPGRQLQNVLEDLQAGGFDELLLDLSPHG